MNDQQFVDETMTLLIVGHYTTATALQWLLCLLIYDPLIQIRLRCEIDQYCASD